MPRRTPPRPTAYAVAAWGTPTEILEALRDPMLTADDVAALAPGYQDPDADAELIAAVLTHPAASSGVVGRYATHTDADIRALVVQHALTPGPALEVLALDPDPQIAATARHRLTHPAPTPPPPPLRRPGRR